MDFICCSHATSLSMSQPECTGGARTCLFGCNRTIKRGKVIVLVRQRAFGLLRKCSLDDPEAKSKDTLSPPLPPKWRNNHPCGSGSQAAGRFQPFRASSVSAIANSPIRGLSGSGAFVSNRVSFSVFTVQTSEVPSTGPMDKPPH